MEEMQSANSLLKKISSQDSPLNRLQKSNDSQTTGGTGDEPFDYWEWYNQPGNSIREYNQSHGVQLVKGETGLYFQMNIETLNAGNPVSSVYPSYFSHRVFSDFSLAVYGTGRQKAEKALDICKKYVDGIDEIMGEYGGGGLYFYSKAKGSGKTFLSTILGNELTRRGKRVRWNGVTNLLQELKSSYDKESGTSSAAIIQTCKEAEILILDDLGVEKQTAWVNEVMYSILDYRMAHSSPTIFTSNIRPLELQYDARVTDRISRMSELVDMPEENVRQRLNAKSRLGEFLGK